jgi:uncharacterized protein YaaQ
MGPYKLLLIIAADADADRLLRLLAERGIPATKLSSSGGFLRRGNTTLLSGLEEERVEEVLELVRRECHARSEPVPLQALPFPDLALPAGPIEVRVGGAVVFVLPVEHFEKT